MTTWNQCITYYEKLFDTIQLYAKTNLKEAKTDTVLKTIGLHFLEKLHINLINCIDALRKVERHPLNFLSLGLLLRGMLSDIINYRYLRQVYSVIGPSDFETEVQVLELDFVRAYKRMVDNEKQMAKGDKEMEKLIEGTFQKNFSEFYKGGELKGEADFRSREFWNKIHEYLKNIDVDETLRISTEAVKMKFIRDQHAERIQILYTYLSQLQHFSGRAYNFYKSKEFSDFNPHFTLMLLFFADLVLISIVGDLSNDEKTLTDLGQLAKEMAEI